MPVMLARKVRQGQLALEGSRVMPVARAHNAHKAHKACRESKVIQGRKACQGSRARRVTLETLGLKV